MGGISSPPGCTLHDHDTGFAVVDGFINDPRFDKEYAPVYQGEKGAIFERIRPR
jgi:hypothetical protein